MRIVDRKTFMRMPPETLYSKYEPCVFEGLYIKGDTIRNDDGEPIDWFYQQIIDAVDCDDGGEFVAILEAAEEGGCFEMDFYCQGRDGCFDQDQLFVVWELDDVAKLINRLTKLLPKSQRA